MSDAARTQAHAPPQPRVEPEAVRPASAKSGSRLMLQRRCACGAGAGSSGECESCAGASRLQRRAAHEHAGAGQGVPSSVGTTLAQPGRPLDAATRADMEQRFGNPFDHVRVHDDAGAAQSAADVDAHAYTVGHHVVFGSGQYRPGTDSGRHLLAHELAHTIQQDGLQRAGTSALVDQGPEYRRLEADADRMADAAMARAPVGTATRAQRPVLARAGRKLDDGAVAPPSAKKKKATIGAVTVTPDSAFERETPKGATVRQESFTVDKLFVPATKGPNALAVYKSLEGKALQATVNVDGRTKAVLWQERAGTDDLRSRWLQAVGWPGGKEADKLWNAAGGDKTFPNVDKEACQMDHIVELQIGGNNTNENIQALDGKQNRDSGGAIKNQVFALGQAIIANTDLSDGTAEQVTMRFQKAEAQGTPESLPKACPVPKGKATCLSVEACARKGGPTAAVAAETAGMVDFEISAGGAASTLKTDAKFKSSPKAVVPIFGDSVNGSAGELIPGLLLNDLHHGAGGLAIDAEIDTREKTRLPIAIEGKKGKVPLKVSAAGKVGFVNATPNLQFTYKYLSPGAITKLKMDDAGGLEWAGYITPRAKFLGRLDVSYQKGELKITKGLEPNKIKPPIKGVRLTKAEISMTLAPEFKPEGTLAFEAGPEKNPIATASITVTKNDNGLVAKGTLNVHLPGVDEAKGEVTYQDGAWSGEIVVQSTQIKIPYVESGSVRVRMNEAGVSADGEVGLALPGGNKATVSLKRSGNKWVFTGAGKFKIPRLDDTEVKVSYDGETLVAQGKTGFTFHELKGTLDPVTYVAKKGEEGKVSGTGKLNVTKGRVTGSITVKLLPSGQFTGEGKVSVRITDKLTANAGIVIDDKQKVRLSGELRIEVIELFKGVHGEKSLFDIEKNIPIPGASIPGVGGLMAKIGGGVSIGYGVGPGTLKNVFIEAAFNPLEDKPDLDVSMGGKLDIPAYAKISGYIKGGIALDATIAEVAGYLTITVSLALKGGLSAEFKGRYAKQRFVVDASADIAAALILGMALDATARAKAGIGAASIEKSKTWNLKRIEVPTGIDFSLKAPIHYASDEAFVPPSLQTIQFSPPPKIDPGDLLGRIFKAATSTDA